MNDDRAQHLECLRLATLEFDRDAFAGQRVVELAEMYFNFVKGARRSGPVKSRGENV